MEGKMKINKLELKNISYYERGSESTPCYNATVYVDGFKAIEVSNDGHGGCDRQLTYPEMQKGLLQEVNKYCIEKFGQETWENGGKTYSIDIDLETWCQTEMYIAQDKKLLKRAMKKNVMFFKNKEDISKGRYYLCKIQNNVMSLMAYVKDKYPQSIILNDMPFDDALKTFRNKVAS
jgi:hypothetical protein